MKLRAAYIGGPVNRKGMGVHDKGFHFSEHQYYAPEPAYYKQQIRAEYRRLKLSMRTLHDEGK